MSAAPSAVPPPPLEDGFGLYLVLTDPVAGSVRCAEAAVEAAEKLGAGEAFVRAGVRQAFAEAANAFAEAQKICPDAKLSETGIGSTIFAVKPGDGSAREQAASCQKVLGGWANIAREYATKRYRSNLINWGMLPLVVPEGDLSFANGDYVFLPGIREAIEEKKGQIKAYALRGGESRAFTMTLGDLTDDEREIIMDGCLINYYRENAEK